MAEKKSSITWYVHHIVTALLIFSGYILPVVEPLTREGMVLLMAFVGAIYGWTFINMLWPSIMAMFSMGLQLGMAKVVAAGLGSPITWFLVFLYILIGLLNETKIVEWIVSFFLSRKIVIGRPWTLITIILIANFVGSLLSGFASLIIFLTFLFTMCKMVGIKPYSKFPTLMTAGIVLTIALSAVVLPFKGTGLNFVIAWQGVTGLAVDQLKFMIAAFPICAFIIGMYVLICRFVLRLDVSQLKEFNPADAGIKATKLTDDQKMALLVTAWALVDMFIPVLFPTTAIGMFMTKITVFGQMAIPILVFMVVRFKDKPVVDFELIVKKHLPWEMFMLMGVIMPLTSFLTADTTGIKALMGILVQPLVNLGTVGFLLLVALICLVLTNVATNFVVGMIFMPLVYAFAMATPTFSGEAALMVLVFITHFAFLTPGATPYAAIALSNGDWIRVGDMLKWGMPLALLLCLTCLPFIYLWSSFIMG